MKALIFSDSHGRTRAMKAAIDCQLSTPDAIFFLGDGLRDTEDPIFELSTLYAVRGNCDWFAGYSDIPNERVMQWAGQTLLLTHGHEYNVKSGTGALLLRAMDVGADIVLFGHTHEPICERIPAGTILRGGRAYPKDIWLFNPGSIGMDGSFGTLSVRGSNFLLSHGEA